MQSSDSPKYQQQRLAAIKAAATVFAHKGYHGASTTDIAETMGIKQGSLYYYFKSKEEALAEVCLYGISDYVQRMEEIAASPQPFEARLLATVTSHLSSYREKNEALKVHNDERLYLPELEARQAEKTRQPLPQTARRHFFGGTGGGRSAPGPGLPLCGAIGYRHVQRLGRTDCARPATGCVRHHSQVTDLLLNGVLKQNSPDRPETTFLNCKHLKGNHDGRF